MPLPFILLGAALLAGGVGAKKGYDGVSDMNKAKKIGKDAESKYENAKKGTENYRSIVNDTANKYGNFKISVLTDTVKPFLDYLKRINQKYAGKEYETLASIDVSEDNLKQLEEVTIKATSVVSGGATSIATGLALQGGTVFFVQSLAAASTGTAISSLGGAAAANATLAWFGGGSLASGGLGMAGGTVVLGGILVGPALAIGGFLLATQGQKALTKSTEYAAEVDKAVANMSIMRTALQGIKSRIEELHNLLIELNDRAKIEISKLLSILDFDANDINSVQLFQKNALLIKAIGEIINTPILDAKGNISELSGKVSVKIKGMINSKEL